MLGGDKRGGYSAIYIYIYIYIHLSMASARKITKRLGSGGECI